MKTLLSSLGILFLTMVSCEDNQKTIEKINFDHDEAVNTVVAIEAAVAAKLGDKYALFTYSSTADAQTKIVPALEGLQHDAISEIPTVLNCVYVEKSILITGGKAVLESFAYMDASGGIISAYKYDVGTSSYRRYGGSEFGGGTGGCPNGYTPIKVCARDEFFGACYSHAMSTYLGQHLENAGCVRIRMQQHLDGVWLCGMTC